MNWNRMLIGLAVAAIVGLLASTFVYRQVTRATAPKPMATRQVVTAAMPLPLGARLQDQNLRTIAWPADSPLPPGTFTRKEECLGRALVSSIVENELLLEAKLAPKEGGAGLSVTIPEGMRAVSVQVNEVIAVAGFVLPGSMVDVLVTGSPGSGENITKTLLENIRVLAAGQQIEQDKEGKPHTVPVITLLVTPEDANKLTMAANQGRIQLALRNTIDTKKADPPSVFQASLFGGGARPTTTHASKRPKDAPSAPPVATPFVVEVIRGGKRETSTFSNP